MNLILIKTGTNMFAVSPTVIPSALSDGKLSTGNTCGMRPTSTEAKASSNRNAPPPNGSLEE